MYWSHLYSLMKEHMLVSALAFCPLIWNPCPCFLAGRFLEVQWALQSPEGWKIPLSHRCPYQQQPDGALSRNIISVKLHLPHPKKIKPSFRNGWQIYWLRNINILKFAFINYTWKYHLKCSQSQFKYFVYK